MPSEPVVTTLAPISAIGIEVRTSNTLEMDATSAKIPGLWGKFLQENTAERIPNKKPNSATLGIYTGYETDHRGSYVLIAGVETTDIKSIPNGMRGITIPSGKYLVFTAMGQMPQALIETWAYIWDYFSKDSGYIRTYSADFERYESSERVEIYIAIK